MLNKVEVYAPNAVQKFSFSAVSQDLTKTILAYQNGILAYNKIDIDEVPDQEVDNVILSTYGTYRVKLENWAHPANNRNSALLALKLALKENEAIGGELLVSSMIKTVLKYLENDI